MQSDVIKLHQMTQDDKKIIECRIHLQDLIRRCPKFPGGKAQRPLQDLQLVHERSYNIQKFHAGLAVYPFDDHSLPEFGQMLPFCCDKIGIHQPSVHR